MNRRFDFKRIALTIASCVLALGLALGLSACSKQNDEELIRASISEVMEVFKNPTEENLKPYIEESDIDLSELEEYDVDLYEFMGHCFKHFDYSIDEVKVDGDKGTATLTLTNADLNAAVTAATEDITANMSDYTDLITSEDGEKEFMKIYFGKVYDALDAATDTVSTEATLKLEKKDGKWDVDDSSVNEVVGAMFGGIEL